MNLRSECNHPLKRATFKKKAHFKHLQNISPEFYPPFPVKYQFQHKKSKREKYDTKEASSCGRKRSSLMFCYPLRTVFEMLLRSCTIIIFLQQLGVKMMGFSGFVFLITLPANWSRVTEFCDSCFMAEDWTLMWKMKNTDSNPAILKKKAKIHALSYPGAWKGSKPTSLRG